MPIWTYDTALADIIQRAWPDYLPGPAAYDLDDGRTVYVRNQSASDGGGLLGLHEVEIVAADGRTLETVPLGRELEARRLLEPLGWEWWSETAEDAEGTPGGIVHGPTQRGEARQNDTVFTSWEAAAVELGLLPSR